MIYCPLVNRLIKNMIKVVYRLRGDLFLCHVAGSQKHKGLIPRELYLGEMRKNCARNALVHAQ